MWYLCLDKPIKKFGCTCNLQCTFVPHSWPTRQTGLTRWTPFRVRRTTGSSLCRDRTARATANGAKAPPLLHLPHPSCLSWRHRQWNTTSLNNNSSVKLVQWNQWDQRSHFCLLGVGYNSMKLDLWNQSNQRSHFLLETGEKTGKHREVSHQGIAGNFQLTRGQIFTIFAQCKV